MEETTVYLVIKVHVSFDKEKNFTEDSLTEVIGSNCDYSISLDESGVEITGTELMACEKECPL